jgi:serine/threonine protein kinase
MPLEKNFHILQNKKKINKETFHVFFQKMNFGPRQVTLHECIGKGSYGSVRRCTISNQEYAAKIIDKDLMLDVIMELVILCSIKHSCLLKVAFKPRVVAHKNVYAIMPLAWGGDLAQYVRENGPCMQDHKRHVLWTSQLCQAVHVLHHYNIVHGDIKARNVLVMSPGQVVLGDFTSSMIITNQEFKHYSTTLTHRTLEEFMSKAMPRKYSWLGKPQDIWALGCTLLEMSLGTGSVLQFLPSRKSDATNNNNEQPSSRDDGSDEKCVLQSIKQLVAFLQPDPDSESSQMYKDAVTYTQDVKEVVITRPDLSKQPKFESLFKSIMRLDPNKRPSAASLIRFPYIENVPQPQGVLLKVNNEAMASEFFKDCGADVPENVDPQLACSIFCKIQPQMKGQNVHTVRHVACQITGLVTHSDRSNISLRDKKQVIAALEKINYRIL